ncbi:S4 domain-containing protein, partial [Thermomonas sp.]|uniref:S4 domain-containing protein n=1 Tax=Thermomonas sp. TaxID=1971895 RepID=UPI0035B2FE79
MDEGTRRARGGQERSCSRACHSPRQVSLVGKRLLVTPRFGLARVLSKRGLCSRTEAQRLIRAGLVRLDGRVIDDPEFPVRD